MCLLTMTSLRSTPDTLLNHVKQVKYVRQYLLGKFTDDSSSFGQRFNNISLKRFNYSHLALIEYFYPGNKYFIKALTVFLQ